jgi:tetratricopeptide (TPR) repeat protein
MHTEVEQTEVNEALAATLADDKFAAAPQMSAFLKYVVEQTLLGHANRIKAYTVAIDALGKPTTFDPQNDPSVRVLAKRLRSSLDAYYERTANPGVVIEMKAGSYVPKFVFTTQTAENQIASDGMRQLHSAPVTPVHPGSNPIQPGLNIVDLKPVPVALAPTARAPTIVPNDKPQSAPESTAVAACQETVCSQTNEIDPKQNGTVPDLDTPTDQQADSTGSALTGDNLFWRKIGRIPRPVVAITVLVVSVWAFTGGKQNTSSPDPDIAAVQKGNTAATQNVVPPFRIELANNQQTQPTHARPALPTISILSNPGNNKLQAQLADTISNVVSHFGNVQVVRSNAHTAYAMHWPEEYRLQISSIVVDNQIRIDIQLLQAQTGQVTYPGTFMLSKAASDHLSKSELESIEEFAANVAQMNGPLMRNYRAQGDYTIDMACLFELQSMQQAQTLQQSSNKSDINTADSNLTENTNNQAATSNNCTTGADAASGAQRLLHEASVKLSGIDNLPARVRNDRLQSAITLSSQAITESPQNAEAHSILMIALQQSGKTDEAIEHGRRSLKLNPYNGNALRSLANLLELENKIHESKNLRNRAARFDPFSVALNSDAMS